jgi:hypothetical protein
MTRLVVQVGETFVRVDVRSDRAEDFELWGSRATEYRCPRRIGSCTA